MTVAQHGLVGDMKAPVDVTYLADTVILLRYFEALGSVRRAMSVIKKRTGCARRRRSANIRIDNRGLTLGEPLDRIPGRAARRSDLSSEKDSRCWRKPPMKAGHVTPSSDAVILPRSNRARCAVAAALDLQRPATTRKPAAIYPAR